MLQHDLIPNVPNGHSSKVAFVLINSVKDYAIRSSIILESVTHPNVKQRKPEGGCSSNPSFEMIIVSAFGILM